MRSATPRGFHAGTVPRAGRPLRIVLLEHPRRPSWVHMNDVANTPLSSSLMTGYAAAVLERAGHQVSVVEAHLGRLSPPETVEAVAAAEPDLVGVHLVYDWSDGTHVRDLLGDLQMAAGPIPVILYGFYPTFAYRRLLPGSPGAVAAVLGEPEATLEEVARVACGGVGRDLSANLISVAGLAVRVGDELKTTPPRALIGDLDVLPFPRRTPEMRTLREVNVAGSRGCYGSCNFCTINPFYGSGSRWRPRSPENVVAEMAQALEEHPEKDRFYFVDPNFFGPGSRGRSRALTLARMIRERFSVRFGLEGRVNDVDEPVVAALAEAGLDEILIGLESGSDATLARLNKRTTVAHNRRALRILRGHGIEPNVGFIMFEPQSSLDDIRVNLAFLEEEHLLRRLEVTANVLYHQQILLAPTPAYQAARAGGRLLVSPHNPYEGTVPYRHPEVAFLAETMAEVCRHVFAGLPPEAWMAGQGSRNGPLGELNGKLVGLFRRLLGELASGQLRPDPMAAREIVEQASDWIAALPTD